MRCVRQLFLLAAAFLVSGANKPEALRYELRFGSTLTSPIGPPVPCAHPTPGHELCPSVEPDYVPNYETFVPQTILSCGGSFVRFAPMTDGAERAFFDVPPDRAHAAVECIKRQVPQGHVEGPSAGRIL